MSSLYGHFDYYTETGDTYASLAKRFGVGENELKEFNGNMPITGGSKLKIPCRHGGCGKGAFYTIKRGDTLYGIARRRGITVDELLKANPYLNPSYYIQGQTIVLPYSGHKAEYYTLGRNERLSHVLKKYAMDLTAFCALNPDISPMNLGPGQRVRVRTKDTSGMAYTLVPGDSLLSVAQKFGVSVGSLLGANRHLKPRGFVPGVTVRIPEKDG